MRALSIGLALALAALALAACGVSTTPFNPEQSCVAVGGIYRANGHCDMVLP